MAVVAVVGGGEGCGRGVGIWVLVVGIVEGGGGGGGCCCCWWLVMKVVVVALSVRCCRWVVVKVVEVVLSVGGSGGRRL